MNPAALPDAHTHTHAHFKVRCVCRRCGQSWEKIAHILLVVCTEPITTLSTPCSTWEELDIMTIIIIDINIILIIVVIIII